MTDPDDTECPLFERLQKRLGAGPDPDPWFTFAHDPVIVESVRASDFSPTLDRLARELGVVFVQKPAGSPFDELAQMFPPLGADPKRVRELWQQSPPPAPFFDLRYLPGRWHNDAQRQGLPDHGVRAADGPHRTERAPAPHRTSARPARPRAAPVGLGVAQLRRPLVSYDPPSLHADLRPQRP